MGKEVRGVRKMRKEGGKYSLCHNVWFSHEKTVLMSAFKVGGQFLCLFTDAIQLE